MSAPRIASLDEELDVGGYGGKAARLAAARRAGLTVPPGLALPPPLIDRLLGGDGIGELAAALERTLAFPVAVRSSALDEDSDAASFAGQHASVLGVRDLAGVLDALREVAASTRTPAAAAYRARLRLRADAPVAALVQTLVPADVAGVLFTADPVSGSRERLVVEAAFGLGEAVVAGLVTPDRFVLDRAGRVLESAAGTKEVTITPASGGGTTTRAQPRPEPSLGPPELCLLADLGMRCERLFAGAQDIEWAFAGGRLHLLQARPITAPAAGR